MRFYDQRKKLSEDVVFVFMMLMRTRLVLFQYGMKKWSLIIDDAQVADKGNYTCIASNEHGSIGWFYEVDVLCKSARSSVRPPPVGVLTEIVWLQWRCTH